MIRKAPENSSHLFRFKKSSALQLTVIVLAVAILGPQFRQFSESWSYLTEARLPWIIAAIVALLCSILCAALVYVSLVPQGLPYGKTVLIQMATYFTNRLLPSGLGGIGFNALYLVKQAKMSRTDAAVFATANNIIGFLAFALCFGAAITTGLPEISLPNISSRTITISLSVAILVAVISLMAFKNIHKRLLDLIGHLVGVIMMIIRNPKRLVMALLCSIGITISYVFILWASTKSVGVEVAVINLFVAFVAGNIALTVSPTPGGIGAVEASITAVLVSMGVTPSLALASVILFRIVSYWVPIIPGYIAFRTALRRSYV